MALGKWIKWFLLGSCFFGVLLGLLLAGGIFYLTSDHAQEFLQSKIDQAISGAITWQDLHVSPISGRIELTSPVLMDAAGHRLAGLDRIFIEIAWAPLFQKTLTLQRIIIEKPWVELVVDNAGELNLVKALSATKPESALPEEDRGPKTSFNIILKSLQVIQGRLQFESSAQNFKAAAEHIDLAAEADLRNQVGDLDFHVGQGQLSSPAISMSISQFELKTSLSEGQLDPLRIRTDTSFGELSLSGKIRRLFTAPEPELSLTLGLILPDVAKGLGLRNELTGGAEVHLTTSGPLGNPVAALQVGYGGGNLFGLTLDSAALDLKLTDRTVTLNNLDVAAADGALKINGDINLQDAFADGFLGAGFNPDAISYQLHMQQMGIKLEKLMTGRPPFSGVVRSELALKGRGVNLSNLSAAFTGSLRASGLKAAENIAPVEVQINTQGHLSHGILTVQQLRAAAGEIRLQADGQYDLARQHLSAKLSLVAPDVAGPLSSLGVEAVSGQLKILADVAGQAKQPVFDLNLTGTDLAFRDFTLGSLQMTARLDKAGLLRISRLNLSNQGTVIKGQGSLQVFGEPLTVDSTLPLQLDVSFHDLEPGDFIKRPAAAGKLNGSLKLSGSIKALEASLALQGRNLALDSLRLGELEADIGFLKGALHLNQVRLQNHKSQLALQGTVQLLKPGSFEPAADPAVFVDLQGDTVFIQDFISSLKGRLSLEAHLEGSLPYPRGKLTLSGSDIDLGVQRLEHLKLSAILQDQKIRLQPLEVGLAPAETITVSGWFGLDKTYRLDLTSPGISLRHIDLLQKHQNDAAKVVEGKVALTIAGAGSLADPELTGQLWLNDLRVNGKTFDPFQIRLDLRDHLARFSGKLNFDMDGTFDLQDKDFSISLRFDETRLGPYFRLADRPDLDGILTGTLKVSGNSAAIDQIEADAAFSMLTFFHKEQELVRSEDVGFTIKQRELTLPPVHLTLLKDGRIDLQGRGRFDGPLNLKLDGVVPVRSAGLFTDALDDLTGNLNLSASIGGTAQRPDIRGEIGLERIGFSLPQSDQKLHDLQGRLLITPEAIRIESLKGQLDTGRFELSGQIGLEGYRPASVQLGAKANALPLQIPDVLDLLLNADFQLLGTEAKSTLQGEVVMLEGTYFKDVNLSLLKGVGQRKRKQPLPSAEISQPFLKNMQLDVALKNRNPFVVDNNLAQLDVTPDLRLTGTLNRPLISGRASIDEGTVRYSRTTFTVKKGVIDFINPYRIEPNLDLEAEVQVRQWMIFLSITGTPENLALKLRSEPSETDGDILSLLLFAKTSNELIGGEGGTAQSTEQMLAGVIASTFGEDIKKATGLDILEVETENQTQGGDAAAAGGVTVTIGKELSERMTVKYALETKEGVMIQRAIAEYKLIENILVSGFQGSDGIFGGALNFRLEFR